MKFSQIIDTLHIRFSNVKSDMDIERICYDSCTVTQNSIFVAIEGFETDGHKYIKAALEKGASVIVSMHRLGDNVTHIVVDDTRIALAKMSKMFYNNSCDHMKMIGITGTNGKTTTTYLIKEMLESRGYKVGLIGTNQNMIGKEILQTQRTTPESLELHELFQRMRESECSHVIMEVSSHSLALSRVEGIEFYVGCFTNLSQDHLDFHRDMEEYAQCKAKLFSMSKISVLNEDDDYFEVMQRRCCGRIYTYSTRKDSADLVSKNIVLSKEGADYTAVIEGQIERIHLNIPGLFSIYNSLCAISASMALGSTLNDCASALLSIHGVRGRVEVVKAPRDYTVIIDYAHSPDGIENILETVKGFCKGRIISLFGCGGDRDRKKRSEMGKAASAHSDLCIVTSDNPRTEKPEDIIADIIPGMGRCLYEVITDRRKAIEHALSIGKKNDVIVLMGKGHETYQEINHVKYDFDEREEIKKYFERLGE